MKSIYKYLLNLTASPVNERVFTVPGVDAVVVSAGKDLQNNPCIWVSCEASETETSEVKVWACFTGGNHIPKPAKNYVGTILHNGLIYHILD